SKTRQQRIVNGRVIMWAPGRTRCLIVRRDPIRSAARDQASGGNHGEPAGVPTRRGSAPVSLPDAPDDVAAGSSRGNGAPAYAPVLGLLALTVSGVALAVGPPAS